MNNDTTNWRQPPRVVVASNHLYDGRHAHRESFRKGAAGEERVVERMLALLDHNWTIFRDVVLPDHRGDIDIVLVGPPGIWAFEVKAYSGDVYVENGRWVVGTSSGRQWRQQRGPNAQVRSNAAALCEFLKYNGITTGNSVKPVVVLAEDTPLAVESTGTDIWRFSELDAALLGLRKRMARNDVQVTRVVDLIESTSESIPAASGMAHKARSTRSWAKPGYGSDRQPPGDGFPRGRLTTSLPSTHHQSRRRAIRLLSAAIQLLVLAIALLVIRVTFLSPGSSIFSWNPFGGISGNRNPLPMAASPGLVALKPHTVSASNSAPDGSDSQGNPVSYSAANVIDGDLTTAWRVPGSGVGEALTLQFDTPVSIEEISLLPGYAKVDPYDGADRFKQNRRVQNVWLEFGDKLGVEVSYKDEPRMQVTRITPVVTQQVRIVVLGSTAPDSADGRDFVAISEVSLRGHKQAP